MRRKLFYQDVNEQFEGYTQRTLSYCAAHNRCFIRMSMNNLKDIHNTNPKIMFYTVLFYQDVNEQFEGYTQPCVVFCTNLHCCFIRMSMNNLKDIHNKIKVNATTRNVVLSGCQ